MRIYKNLTLIGTSHIAIESIKEVERTILQLQPNIVALELDKPRLESLLHKGKTKLKLSDIKILGIKGFLFNIFAGWIERKLGKLVGVTPGDEMLKAVETSKKINAKIKLIDQPINITLKRLSQTITWKEKFKFAGDLIKGFIFRKEIIKFDLTKVPPKELIQRMMEELKERYPSVYLTLIEERNIYMAKNLYKLIKLYNEERIIAVIGAGHEQELLDLIKQNEQKNNL